MPMIEESANFDKSGFFIAEVKNNIDPLGEGRVAVYIPKLMYQNEYDEEAFEQINDIELNDSLLINSDDFKDTEFNLESSNYMWARPLSFFEENKNSNKEYISGSLRVPRIGSRIIVIFLDNDIQKCYYLPYSPTYDGDKLDSYNTVNNDNFKDIKKIPNIDVIRFYYEGTRIEVDTNTHTIKLATSNGNHISISNNEIKIKGNVTIDGNLNITGNSNIGKELKVGSTTDIKGKLNVDSDAYLNHDVAVKNNVYWRRTKMTFPENE